MDPRRLNIARKWGVLVLSQRDVLGYVPPPGAVLIRISGWNPTGESRLLPLPHLDLYTETLVLEFDDARSERPDRKLIGDDDVRRIVDFFSRHKDASLVVIHCQGGISRSSAVGLAWTVFVERTGAAADFNGRTSPFDPNPLVVDALLREIARRRGGA